MRTQTFTHRIIDPSILYDQMLQEMPITIIDIRSVEAFERGHIRSAIHLPWRMIDELNTMGWDTKILYIVCGNGAAGHDESEAQASLDRLGLQSAVLTGGATAWSALQLPLTERPARSKFCCGRGCGCQ